MSITRLQQARQMYAMGQRVGRIAFGGGGTYGEVDRGYQGGGKGGYGDAGKGSATGGTGEGNGEGQIVTQNPVYGDPDPYTDNPLNKRDTITSFMDNYNTQKKTMGLKNFIPGMQFYNIAKTAYDTAQARKLLGLAPTTVGPDIIDSDGGEGIMEVYTPEMLDITDSVVEEEEITPFENRFELSPDVTQAKGIERLIQYKAIAEMIGKLYT